MDFLRKKLFIYFFIVELLSILLTFLSFVYIAGFEYIYGIIRQNMAAFIISLFFIFIFIILIAVIAGNFIIKNIVKDVSDCISDSVKKGEKVTGDLKEIYMLFEEERNKENEIYKKEINELKQQIKRLEYDRKKEIDPESFKQFIKGIDELTKTERKIFDLHREGYSVQEILDIAKIKESTLRYHNQNIYAKLSVSSMKMMLRYCALMENEENL
ncbi:helix-turn-helix transcriptional regulator [Lachnoanaerobaculum gingivalis]|uniref:helix-turn-helix transcriptional regulator n=1 Tax=Lachnoanaerobaculum gingivalis TaxID=2490855 RepID=UPI0024A7818A|nr:helix-turn-helix transcriptional regulator [Lachnoanaerobaculum gingivalis]WHE87168.1 helix-turn-helix transcriptional regulator [Lachnoanaerobaculum gingivalis]